MPSASSTNRFARYASTLRPISSQPFALTLPKFIPCGSPLTSWTSKGLPYFARWYPLRLQFHILSRRSISFQQENVIVPCHPEFHRHYHFTISVPTISLAKAGIFVRKSPQRCSECPWWWNISVKIQALCMWDLRVSTKWQLLSRNKSRDKIFRVSGPYVRVIGLKRGVVWVIPLMTYPPCILIHKPLAF